MPSINEVLERAAPLKPSPWPDDAMAAWLMELDGKLWDEFFPRYQEHNAGGSGAPAVWPEDGDKPLLVTAPYDNLYDLYLFAMIDFHDREWDSYNNSMTMFNRALEEFRKQWHRTHTPVGTGGWRGL